MLPGNTLRALALSSLSVALATSASPAAAQSSIRGTWSGTVVQSEGSSGYAMVMTITPISAATDYPSLNCSGTLRRVGSGNGYLFFTETITRGGVKQGGNCLDGTITIALDKDKLAWGWFGVADGKPINAFALLSRR